MDNYTNYMQTCMDENTVHTFDLSPYLDLVTNKDYDLETIPHYTKG